MPQDVIVNLGLLGVTVVGVLASIWQAHLARQARDDAESAGRRAEEAEARANAIALSSVEALREANRLTTDRVPELVQVSYDTMLRALRPVGPDAWQSGSVMARIDDWVFEMLRIGEMVDGEEPWIPEWFEAERQRALRAATDVGEHLKALFDGSVPVSPDDLLDATGPYNRWAAEFTNNLRMWRSGRASEEQLRMQAESIERMLRARGEWHTPMAWRTDVTDETSVRDASETSTSLRDHTSPPSSS